MSYLHDHDFVHRNLTSSAVLLTSNLRAKIDIFELGNDSEMSTRAMYFNIPWMAPEVHACRYNSSFVPVILNSFTSGDQTRTILQEM